MAGEAELGGVGQPLAAGGVRRGTILPGGYEVLEPLGSGGMGDVLLARALASGTKVAVKIIHGRSGERHLERFAREMRVARRIRHPNVVELLDVNQTAEGVPFYVMEFLDGDDLATVLSREGALGWSRARAIMIEILHALAAAHERGVVHRDLKPSNCICIRSDAGELVKLVDFGIAKVASDDPEEANLTRTGSVLGTPHYMSPEQAVGHEVDARADIYSAGVILFELLTGQVPFAAANPMGVLGRLITEAPPSPRRIAPEAEISPELEALILRALAKRPEERFESATAFAEALRRVAGGPRRAAPTGIFRRPRRLYGRDEERAALLGAFNRATAGERVCVLLSGDAGIGKSALVTDVLAHRAHLSAAKFDPESRDSPFVALLAILRQLVAFALGQDEEARARLQARLVSDLGLGLPVVAQLLPELEALVGRQAPPAAASASASRNRLHAALLRLLALFADLERPLVLFLDDLQWADAASLDLLGAAIVDVELRHLLVIGAFREGEVDPVGRLARALEELRRASSATLVPIHIGPLHLEDIRELVADTLGDAPDAVDPLSRDLFRRSEGNPLFVHQLLRVAYDAGILAFDGVDEGGAWRWHLDVLDALAVDVAQLIASQIDRLPPATRDLLEVAACVGGEIELGVLADVVRRPRERVAEELDAAVEADLLVRSEGGAELRLRFAHDRIREAAAARVAADALPELHLRIGRRLASAAAGDALPLTAVSHLSRGRALIHAPEERRAFVRACLAASRRARVATAYDGALRLLEAGAELVDEARWREDPAETFALHAELAECTYLSGDFEAAEARLAALAARELDLVDGLAVDTHRVLLNLTRGAADRSIAVGLAALARAGIRVPEDPAERARECEVELAAIWAAIGERSIVEIADAPLCEEPETRAILRLLTELIAPAHMSAAGLADLLICKIVNLSLTRGSTDASAYGYVLFAFFLVTRRPQRAAHDFGRLALALNERLGDASQESRLHFVFGSILHLFAPLPEVLTHLERALVVGLEIGDHVFASYACSHALIALIGAGAPLSAVRERARAYLRVMGRTRVASSTAAVKIAGRVIACLLGETATPTSLTGESFDEAAVIADLEGQNLGFPCLWYHVAKLQLAYRAGDLCGVMAALRAGERRLSNLAWFVSTEFFFYKCMALAELARSAPAEADLAALRADADRLGECAALCPLSFAHKEALLRAELAALGGDDVAAAQLYDRAIAAARAANFPSMESLAAERAARLQARRGLLEGAGLHAGVALAAAERWGARVIVDGIADRFAALLEGSGWPQAERDAGAEGSRKPEVREEYGPRLQILARILAEEAGRGDALPRLLERVVKDTGADHGAILRDRGAGFEVVLAYDLNTATLSRGTGRTIDPEDGAPLAPLRLSLRTGEVMVVDSVDENPRFAGDPYIQRRRPRSLVCEPLRALGRTQGGLYLESRRSYAHFSAAALEYLAVVSVMLALALVEAPPASAPSTEPPSPRTHLSVEELRTRVE